MDVDTIDTNSEVLEGGVFCDEKYRSVADAILISAIAYASFQREPDKLRSIMKFLNQCFDTTAITFVALWTYASISVSSTWAFLGFGIIWPFIVWNGPLGFAVYRGYYTAKYSYRYLLQFPMCTLLTQTARGLGFVRDAFYNRVIQKSSSTAISPQYIVPLTDIAIPQAEKAVEAVRMSAKNSAKRNSPKKMTSVAVRMSAKNSATRKSPTTVVMRMSAKNSATRKSPKKRAKRIRKSPKKLSARKSLPN
jgi:hypothetical protein